MLYLGLIYLFTLALLEELTFKKWVRNKSTFIINRLLDKLNQITHEFNLKLVDISVICKFLWHILFRRNKILARSYSQSAYLHISVFFTFLIKTNKSRLIDIDIKRMDNSFEVRRNMQSLIIAKLQYVFSRLSCPKHGLEYTHWTAWIRLCPKISDLPTSWCQLFFVQTYSIGKIVKLKVFTCWHL